MEIKLKEASKVSIQSSQDTYELMRTIFFDRSQELDLHKEHFWTIALNVAMKILSIELVSIGDGKSTIADTPEILRVPLYKTAKRLILVHNHPSGTLKPSREDMDITNRILQAGLIMDIEVIDHVIFTPHSYYSFVDNGLIEKLKKDKTYVLTFTREKQIKARGVEEGIKKGIKKGTRQEKRRIVEQLLGKGLASKDIKELTGVSSQWLGRIREELRDEKQDSTS